MTNVPRKPGEFCWINILTPSPATERVFFGKLLGWQFPEMPGMGHGIEVGGVMCGGLFDLNGPQTPKGTPPHIGVMVKVASADETAKQVVAAGGKAQPAFDIGSVGRMAVCHDPLGANFDLWQAKQDQPGVDVSLHGAPSWFENLTTNSDRAGAFYGKVFGWAPKASPSEEVKYTYFQLGDKKVAGLMQMTPEMGKMPTHWAVYFTVKNSDETAKECKKLGGRICMPELQIPGVGKMYGLVSPQGVNFYAITYYDA